MFLYRVITAIILIPLVVLAILKMDTVSFCYLTGAITLWGAWEWGTLMGTKNKLWRLIYVLFIAACIYGTWRVPVPYVLYTGAAWWLVALLLILRFPKTQFWRKGYLLRSLMGVVVLVPCWLAMNYIHGSQGGPYILLFLLVIIWGADTGAYFFGKLWGKHKLLPEVSPGKTWQGFLGAVIFTLLIVGGGFYLLHIPEQQWIYFAGLGLITMVFSIVGDLTESMMKRVVKIKDSGHLLPGHGGLLDRIDSLTAAAPIFTLCLLLMKRYLIG